MKTLVVRVLCLLFAVNFCFAQQNTIYWPASSSTSGCNPQCGCVQDNSVYNSCFFGDLFSPVLSGSTVSEFSKTLVYPSAGGFTAAMTRGYTSSYYLSLLQNNVTLPAGQTSISFSVYSNVGYFVPSGCDPTGGSSSECTEVFELPYSGVNVALIEVGTVLGSSPNVYNGGAQPFDFSNMPSNYNPMPLQFITNSAVQPRICGYFRVPASTVKRYFQLVIVGESASTLLQDSDPSSSTGASKLKWVGGAIASGACATDPNPLPALNCNWSPSTVLAQCQAGNICCGQFGCGIVMDACENVYGCSANPCSCTPLTQSQACGNQCGVTVPDNCGGSVQCPTCPTNPPPPPPPPSTSTTGVSTPAPTTVTPAPTTTTPAPTTPAPTEPAACYLSRTGLVRCKSSNEDQPILVNSDSGVPLAVYGVNASLVSTTGSSKRNDNGNNRNPRASVSISYAVNGAVPKTVEDTFPLVLPVYRPLLDVLRGKSNRTSVQLPVLIRHDGSTTLLVNTTLNRIQNASSGIILADIYLNICDISNEVRNKKPKQGDASLDFLRRFPKISCPGVLIASYTPLLLEQSTEALAANMALAMDSATTTTTTAAASNASQMLAGFVMVLFAVIAVGFY